MCGICGAYSLDNTGPADPQLVKAMNQVMVHRGPDDDGYYFDDRVALGMRRLSIIDLITGKQPIHNEDKRIWTVYNGEIYNFPQLRERLIQKGHAFYTNSDTEVIVHLYEEDGEDFVNRLNGMFAIALWDIGQQKLVLARDRLGIKPLHYLTLDNRFYFASEIKSLLRTGCQRTLDLEAVSQFFTFEYIPAPRTIFEGIKKLMPGQMAVLKDGRLSTKPYWDLSYPVSHDSRKKEDDYAREIIHRLRESVRMRLISDVPLGVFLSGGIDSSTVTALMSEVAGSRVRTFSIGFREKSFDELDYARIVADRFQTEHKEFVVDSRQVTELIPVLMEYLDEPLADASIIPTYIISRLAREHVTVALAGDGGDELFAGYDTYKAFKLAQYYRKVPRLVRDGLVRKVINLLPASKKRLSFEFKAKKFISGIDYPPEVANTIWWGAYSPAEKERLFSDSLNAQLKTSPFAPIALHSSHCRAGDTLSRLGYLDLKLYLQDDLLVKVDRMSMANSLEIRVPFLDYTLVEFAASIPSALKLKRLTTKHILKRAMRTHLPPEILIRKKIGFDIPLGVWIKNELKGFVSDVLSPSNLAKHKLFKPAFVEKTLDEHCRGLHNHRQLLWPLVIFQFWYDRYIDR